MPNKLLLISMIVIFIGAAVAHFQLRPPAIEPSLATSSVPEITVDINDPELKAASDKARASLNYFFSMAESQPKDATGFSVRVALTEANITEYFWIYPFERHDNGFLGRVQSEPKQLTQLTVGQAISFSEGQIIDWTFDDKSEKITHGNYTGCVELHREAPEHAEQFMKLLGLQCDIGYNVSP